MVMLEEQTQQAINQGGDRTQVQEALENLIQQVNQGLEPHEKLDFLVVLSEPWTMDNGLLTPTMKIKRQKIEDHYATRFEAWEKQHSAVVWD